ncbi:MAG: L-histidine N(alpha)-methyltransferase [Proteobacteria bacterium]|nr:L-histidine N(alpha)-methyltransferase [Pseudomonadota bacterium]MCP4922172.1 L-histidine N(alpha)-methyltransferase [Pseudomonadota bacterium]
MTFRVLEPRPTTGADQLAIDVLVGLSERPKRLPSSLFYDDEGSRLFQAITKTPDYYPPRAELEIFESRGPELLASVAGSPVNVVDLGAGDGHKTAVLLDQLLQEGSPVRYVPIDISGGALATVTSSMAERFPGLEIEGLQSEYFNGLRWLGEQSDRRSMVLFLGSNIGNFDKARARGFLRQLWMALNDGDLALIGFDLKKDIEQLLAAYNDSEGLTSAFNLNLLTRMNTELGADFDVSRFRHYGTYNAETGAMESYLVSQEAQTVRIPALQATFTFQPWEPIHTEYSYKYLRSDIRDLARFTGFEIVDEALDENGWFCSSLWRAKKG